MQWIIGGGLVFLAVLAGLKWLATAEPKDIRKMFFVLSVVASIMVGLWLALTGKLAGLLAVGAAIIPFLFKVFRWHQLFQQAASIFGMAQAAHTQATGGAASPGASSSVDTDWLEMVLDHDSGDMDGEVKLGTFAGARLSQLSPQQLLELLVELSVDVQSAELLEAYLDRRPDCDGWRDQPGGSEQQRPRGAASEAPMDREEALRVLGLEEGAGPEEIKKAYQNLMRMVHPDRGGSDYLAAKINRAREILLGDGA